METLSPNYIPDKNTIDQLFNNSLILRTSEDFIKYVEFIKRFNHYSRYNVMLVFIQNPAVTFFGSQSFWRKKFNRLVDVDAKPLIILAPMTPVILVYDIFDTIGEKSPKEFLDSGAGRNLFMTKGRINYNILQTTIEKTRDLDIKVSYKPMSYFASGLVRTIILSDVIEICLKKDMSPEEQFAVLIHELAHVFLGHSLCICLTRNTDKKKFQINHRDIPRHIEELEAETVSHLICTKQGLQTPSADYLACYIRSKEDLSVFSYETVIKTADKIEKLFIQN
jgi:hypothetical protein